MKIRWSAICVSLFFGSLSLKAEPYFEVIDVFSGKEDITYRDPAIAVSPSGVVLCFATKLVGRPGTVDAVSNCVLKRSFDGGKTWESEEIIPNKDVHSKTLYPVVDHLRKKIILLGIVRPTKSESGRYLGDRSLVSYPHKFARLGGQILTIESSDDGTSWSEPRDLTEELVAYPRSGFFWNIGAGIQLTQGEKKGRLLFPGRHFETIEGSRKGPQPRGNVIYSDDGINWQFGGRTKSGFGEPAIVELDDGSILMSNANYDKATKGSQGWSTSFDFGEKFDIHGISEDLKERSPSQGSFLKLPKNDEEKSTILFAKSSGKRKNYGLVIYTSKDECKTWENAKEIEPAFAGKPCLSRNEDGNILCAFEGISYKKLRVASFSLEWLQQEETEENSDN